MVPPIGAVAGDTGPPLVGQTGGVTAAIDARGVSRSFESGKAVDDLTLELRGGEVLALLGPNGAGKTTTVRLCNGVLQPDEGQITVLGLDARTQGTEVRRRTGVLTENAGLDERLTARENLVYAARLRGFRPPAARRRADELLERFSMGPRADDRTQGFSTGQRKRVALARALLHDPEVLFLDEPTSGLDPSGTRDVIQLIGDLAGEGRTIVLATHFLGEAGRLATRMAVLHRGRLQAYGAPAELAAELWKGLRAEIDLDGRADPGVVGLLGSLTGVTRAEPVDAGVLVDVDERAVLPHLVATLAAREIPVFGLVARAPTLEDVYFALEERILAQEAAGGGPTLTDAFAARTPQESA